MAENRQYDHEYKVQAVKLAKEIGQALGAGSQTPQSAMTLNEELLKASPTGKRTGERIEEEYISIKRKLRNLVRRKKKLAFIFGLFSTIVCFGYVLNNTEADAAPISVSILASLICGVIVGPFWGFLFHFCLSVFDYQL